MGKNRKRRFSQSWW